MDGATPEHRAATVKATLRKRIRTTAFRHYYALRQRLPRTRSAALRNSFCSAVSLRRALDHARRLFRRRAARALLDSALCRAFFLRAFLSTDLKRRIIARCSTMDLPLRLSLSRFAASSVTCLGPHNSRPSIRKRTKKKGLCFSDLPAFTCTEPDLWPSLPRGVPRVAGDRGVPATFGDVELPWRCLFIGVVELCWHCLFLGDSCPADLKR